MRRFLAGMLTMLVLIVGGFVVLFGALRQPGNTIPRDVSLGPGVRPSQPPADLRPGETWLGDVDLTSSALVTPDGPLREVHAKGTNVRVMDSGVRIGEVTLVATLPFAVAAAQIGQDVSLYDAGGGLAGVRRRAEVLGFDLAISAVGRVSVEDGGLLIAPEQIDVGLPGIVNDALSQAARDLVTIRQSIEGLPERLVLTAISVRPHGFQVTLRGVDVVLAQAGG